MRTSLSRALALVLCLQLDQKAPEDARAVWQRRAQVRREPERAAYLETQTKANMETTPGVQFEGEWLPARLCW